MSKISIEDIRNELAEDGWTLVTPKYTNLDTEMEYKCNVGHTVIAPWKKLRGRHVCPTCNKNVYEIKGTPVGKKKKDEFRVLAFDQATRVSGFSLYTNKKLIQYGTFEATGENDIERCAKVKQWMLSLIDLYQPDYIGFEGIQYQVQAGVTTFEVLARLYGALAVTCYELGIRWGIAHTAVWRAHCGVKGKTRADKKKSMQLLVKQWFGFIPSEDESDAIGIGKYFSDTKTPEVEIVDWEVWE